MDELLTRGVSAILPDQKSLSDKISTGPIRLFMGIDATGPSLHLGHLASLLKLKDFQQAGHEVIVLLGDFTTQIGDPTDKLAVRKTLSPLEVEANMADYRRQILLVLNKDKTTFRCNSEWFNSMTLPEFFRLATEFTDRDLVERDMFVERKKQGKPVYVNELLYPLIQGYDSVALGVDLEVGGNDQIFNMLAGRDLLARRGHNKFVLATKLLVDPTGKKMGKTEGNMASLTDAPEEIFGKIMSWPDTLMPLGFEILTRVPQKQSEQYLAGHPREAKLALAEEVVALIYGDRAAAAAKEAFVSTFSHREVPSEINTVAAAAGEGLMDLLVKHELVKSKSEFRRLVEQGGVEVGGVKLDNPEALIESEATIKIGPRRFIKITIQ